MKTSMMMNFLNEEKKARIDITERISHEGDSNGWFGSIKGFNLDKLKDSLKEAGGKDLEIHINSGGGEVFEGFAIYNELKAYEGKKTVYIDGIAGSIASVIAMCGDEIVMREASMFMIHNASGGCWGTAKEMLQVAQALEEINEVIRGLYAKKTGKSTEEIGELMDNETFIKPQRALELGLCNKIDGEMEDEEQTLAAEKAIRERMNASLETLKSLQDYRKGFSFTSDEPKEQDPTNTSPQEEEQPQPKETTLKDKVAGWLKGE